MRSYLRTAAPVTRRRPSRALTRVHALASLGWSEQQRRSRRHDFKGNIISFEAITLGAGRRSRRALSVRGCHQASARSLCDATVPTSPHRNSNSATAPGEPAAALSSATRRSISDRAKLDRSGHDHAQSRTSGILRRHDWRHLYGQGSSVTPHRDKLVTVTTHGPRSRAAADASYQFRAEFPRPWLPTRVPQTCGHPRARSRQRHGGAGTAASP